MTAITSPLVTQSSTEWLDITEVQEPTRPWKGLKLTKLIKILGSESFARWLVSLVLALALAPEIEHYHITASVNHLTCPLPPHQSVI